MPENELPAKHVELLKIENWGIGEDVRRVPIVAVALHVKFLNPSFLG